MAATLSDVAALAGVSPKTVSRVINDEPGVAAGTRDRVLEALADTGYCPDPAARSLRTGRSGLIGLAVPELAQPFFAEIADGIAAAAARHGWSVVLGVTGERGEGEESFLRRNPGLDGVIIYWQGLTPGGLEAESLRRLVDGDAGPAADHGGDLLGVDDLGRQGGGDRRRGFGVRELLLQLRDLAIGDL